MDSLEPMSSKSAFFADYDIGIADSSADHRLVDFSCSKEDGVDSESSASGSVLELSMAYDRGRKK